MLFVSFVLGCVVTGFIAICLHIMTTSPVAPEVIEYGLYKHLKTGGLVTFGELYYLLELSPKDMQRLQEVLSQRVQDGKLQRVGSDPVAYRIPVNILA